MKCEEFEDRLNQALDQRRRPEWDADLRVHCDYCAECRELAAAYGVLLDAFYALATPEPPADLSVRVLDELRSRPSTSRRVSLATALVAMAAAALFVLPVLHSVRDRSDEGPRRASGPVALRSTQRGNGSRAGWNEIDALPVVGPVLVSISDDDETTDPYAELAKGTGQGLASVVLYMPSIGSSPGMISPNVVSGAPSWPQRVSEGLKPVTESVSETLDLLLRALPMSESASRS
ncbi:MAG: hypothetical protein WD063_02175 [Pirellulales bacterium]